MKAALISVLVLFSLSAHAADEMGTWTLGLSEEPGYGDAVPPGTTLQKLLTLSTDRDDNIYDLSAMLDNRSHAPTGMYVTSGNTGRAFLLSDIERPEGVTLFEAQGRKVLLFQGTLNRDTQEGRMHLKYLANGLSMTYETCDVLLRKTGNSFWVQNAYTGARVTAAKVLTYWAGVTTIQGICPAKGF